MENYFDKAVIVDLTVRCWSGKVSDNSATRVVSETYEIKTDRGNFTKFLVPKEIINEIKKYEQRLRIAHYKNTLPWGERGERLLPMKHYFKYMEIIEKCKDDWYKCVDKFVQNYTDIINTSRFELGRLFREEEYPSPSVIRGYFDVVVNVFPIPTTDFRLSLHNEEVEKIKSQLESVLKSRFEEAGRDLFVRVSAIVKRIKDRLSDEDAKYYHRSIFTSVNEFAELIEALNVFENEEVSNLVKEVKETFGKVNVEEVKANPQLKNKIVVDADRILDKMNKYFV